MNLHTEIEAQGRPLPRVIAVVGTTASGKSDLAILLAERLQGEVVSADSRQVYRGLDIGSGKVSRAERARVPHHLLDVVELQEAPESRFTVADYQARAFTVIEDVWERGRVPILVGGTGLYVRAVIDHPLYPPGGAGHDPALRMRLEATPLGDLVAQLGALDPATAQRIDRANPRRVVRALETILSTGTALGAGAYGSPRVEALQLGLTHPREELIRRIEARVESRMTAQPSMLDEVRGLIEAGISPGRLDELGLEYRFLSRVVTGELAEGEAIRLLKIAIRQFARRQMTWFRRDGRIVWLNPSPAVIDEAERLARAFLA